MPTEPNWHPAVTLSDAQWAIVIRCLEDRGTKRHGSIARSVRNSVERARARRHNRTP